jgi:excisionase family DNA binding protein
VISVYDLLDAIHPGTFSRAARFAPDEKPPPVPATLLTTTDAATYLNISPESLRRLVRRKAISFVAVLPSEFRFRQVDLEEYVMSRWNRRRSTIR